MSNAGDDSKWTVRNTFGAFAYAHESLGKSDYGWGQNATTRQISQDFYKPQTAVIRKLHEMGQTRFINLTHSYDESRISIALYAGDGIVTKIIPSNYYDYTDPVLSLPPITLEEVKPDEDDINSLLIATYPWVQGCKLPLSVLKQRMKVLEQVGLTCREDDMDPRNFSHLPDGSGTLTTIDAYIYMQINNGHEMTERQKQAWRQYIEEMYPIYKTGFVAPQTDQTDFSFTSIHNPDHGLLTFDLTRDDPIVRAPKQSPAKQPFWASIFGTPKDDAPDVMPS